VPVHAAVSNYRLLERTTYMDMPPECAPWELPVLPLAGETWLPGAADAMPNWKRLADALPALGRCLERAPVLTEKALSEEHSGHRARSLSALYRLDRLSAIPGGYDVLHAHFGPVGESFRFARELWRAPLVVSFHGYDFSTLPRKQGPRIYEKLFATADRVTVNSEFTRSCVARLGCPRDKLRKLPVGLDLEAFPFRTRKWQSGGPVRALTVARLVEIKGHEFAIRAVAKARRRHPELHYDIVGDGPLRKALEALIVKLKLSSVITLHGALDGALVQDLMARAHLAVQASVNVDGDQEGQGLFLQEAQACGLPVVATQHGALAEGLVPEQSGFLVPERDVSALAARLEFLLEHTDGWPEMGLRGRKFVARHYDIRRLNEQLVQLYRDAVTDFDCSANS
jgi:colanic acid/amylovoran biosynthesis glycosyltransferase